MTDTTSQGMLRRYEDKVVFCWRTNKCIILFLAGVRRYPVVRMYHTWLPNHEHSSKDKNMQI